MPPIFYVAKNWQFYKRRVPIEVILCLQERNKLCHHRKGAGNIEYGDIENGEIEKTETSKKKVGN